MLQEENIHQNISEGLARLKLIISEVDGVVTEGSVPQDELGNTLFKMFCLKDFEAINEIKKDFKFVFISSDQSISYNLCKRKNIPFFWAKPNAKRQVLGDILDRYAVTADEVLYLGYTYSDLECIKMIPLSASPIDSVQEVRNASLIHLDAVSGMGVLCELYDYLLKPEIRRRNTCL